MKVRIAAFRNISTGNVSTFEWDAEAYGYARVSEFCEVELPDRDPGELKRAAEAVKARKIADLHDQLAALSGVTP